MSEYVSVLDLGCELGEASCIRNHDCTVFRRQIERYFPGVSKKIKQRGRSGSEFIWAIPLEMKESIIHQLGYFKDTVQTAKIASGSKRNYERECALELERQGYVALVTKEKGTPDVIAFRKRLDGGFDLVVREVKGPSDSLHKEQDTVLKKLRAAGIDAEVEWLS